MKTMALAFCSMLTALTIPGIAYAETNHSLPTYCTALNRIDCERTLAFDDGNRRSDRTSTSSVGGARAGGETGGGESNTSASANDRTARNAGGSERNADAQRGSPRNDRSICPRE
jgi:hypothetical protein